MGGCLAEASGIVCHGSVVMAGWRCLQADASSRWPISYQDRPFPTDAEHDRGCCARREQSRWRKLAQLTGQNDPFGTAAKTPLPLQSRANVRPQNVPVDAEANAPRWVAAMDGAPGGASHHSRNTRSRSRVPAEPRASFAPLRSRASRSVRTGPSRATTRRGRAAWP